MTLVKANKDGYKIRMNNYYDSDWNYRRGILIIIIINHQSKKNHEILFIPKNHKWHSTVNTNQNMNQLVFFFKYDIYFDKIRWLW
jgi:hypothetical protein